MSAFVPISWGELVDKITILEIKSERVTSPAALTNIRRELQLLSGIAAKIQDPGGRLAALKRVLKRINEKLWTIEDRIREKEANGSFDQEFIDLARSVYRNNDERGRLKRDINLLLDSELVEEKQYSAY
jgi:Family of unknown function (DUF6165)